MLIILAPRPGHGDLLDRACTCKTIMEHVYIERTDCIKPALLNNESL